MQKSSALCCSTELIPFNLASKDLALDTIIQNPLWAYLAPLKRLRLVYADLKKPGMRLRKDGTETRKDGSLVANPQRMGPLTMEARGWGLSAIMELQAEVNLSARHQDRPQIDLINSHEFSRILDLIDADTWPQGWTGTEPLATEVTDDVLPGGNVQPVMHSILAA